METSHDLTEQDANELLVATMALMAFAKVNLDDAIAIYCRCLVGAALQLKQGDMATATDWLETYMAGVVLTLRTKLAAVEAESKVKH